jgi:hypothetical protein
VDLFVFLAPGLSQSLEAGLPLPLPACKQLLLPEELPLVAVDPFAGDLAFHFGRFCLEGPPKGAVLSVLFVVRQPREGLCERLFLPVVLLQRPLQALKEGPMAAPRYLYLAPLFGNLPSC